MRFRGVVLPSFCPELLSSGRARNRVAIWDRRGRVGQRAVPAASRPVRGFHHRDGQGRQRRRIGDRRLAGHRRLAGDGRRAGDRRLARHAAARRPPGAPRRPAAQAPRAERPRRAARPELEPAERQSPAARRGPAATTTATGGHSSTGSGGAADRRLDRQRGRLDGRRGRAQLDRQRRDVVHDRRGRRSTSTGTGGSGSTSSTAAGTIVPLYTDPSDASWDAIITAAEAHPTVHVVAIVNPSDGPGSSKNSGYTTGIAALQAAGIKVIGYVATGYGSHSIASMEAEMDPWKSFYPTLQGIFFDEQSNSDRRRRPLPDAVAVREEHGARLHRRQPRDRRPRGLRRRGRHDADLRERRRAADLQPRQLFGLRPLELRRHPLRRLRR